MTFTQLFIFTTEYECDLVIHTNTRTSFTEEGYILSIELFPLVWLSISQYKANGLETRAENIFCLLKFDRGFDVALAWWDDNKCTESQNTINKSTHNQGFSPDWTHLQTDQSYGNNHRCCRLGIRENITRERERASTSLKYTIFTFKATSSRQFGVTLQ